MIPVVDAHHHIWRQRRSAVARRADAAAHLRPLRADPPRLSDRGISRRTSLGTGVVKSVYVQANWAPERAEDEVAWVQRDGRRDRAGRTRIVGYADLLAADVRPALDRLARYPLMRGIRMQLHWHENPQYRFAAKPDLADDATFRRNIAALADYGFSFDLQVFAGQMEGAARLAARFPARRPSSCSTPACWKTCRRRAGRHGGRACSSSRRSRTSSQSSPASARSSMRNDPAHIAWIVRRDGRALRRRSAASSARTSRSRSCGPSMRRCSTPTGRHLPIIPAGGPARHAPRQRRADLSPGVSRPTSW